MNAFAQLLGNIAGLAVAPAFWLVTWIRRARSIHTYGACYTAEVKASPKACGDVARDIAKRLEGLALVRFSSTLWRSFEGFDGLGCAIRFGPKPDHQDLLFATTRHIWSLPGALFRTDAHDYFVNDYYAVVPYQWETQRLWLRLVTDKLQLPSGNRTERLWMRLKSQTARLSLQIRLSPHPDWHPLAEIQLRGPASVDQQALRFDPLSSGLGLKSRGLIQTVRSWVYPASQNRTS